MLYRLTDVEVDCDRFLLLRKNQPVRVQPKVLELIIFLIEQRQRMVTRQELLRVIWNNRIVVPSVLPRAICLAREALGRESIRTVHGRGYQWTAPVELIAIHPNSPRSQASPAQGRVPGTSDLVHRR